MQVINCGMKLKSHEPKIPINGETQIGEQKQIGGRKEPRGRKQSWSKPCVRSRVMFLLLIAAQLVLVSF